MCHANVAQLWSSLSKTRGVASLWRYGVCLSRAEGHPAVTDPRFPPTPFPPNKRIPMVWLLLDSDEQRVVPWSDKSTNAQGHSPDIVHVVGLS